MVGTAQGDIHDIGKNIVRIVLESGGFAVVDQISAVGQSCRIMFIRASADVASSIAGLRIDRAAT